MSTCKRTHGDRPQTSLRFPAGCGWGAVLDWWSVLFLITFVSVIYDASKWRPKKYGGKIPELSPDFNIPLHLSPGRNRTLPLSLVHWQGKRKPLGRLPSDLFTRGQACSLANEWEPDRRRLRKESREDETWIGQILFTMAVGKIPFYPTGLRSTCQRTNLARWTCWSWNRVGQEDQQLRLGKLNPNRWPAEGSVASIGLASRFLINLCSCKTLHLWLAAGSDLRRAIRCTVNMSLALLLTAQFIHTIRLQP